MERMQDARTSLELFLICLPHFDSFRGFSCSLIPSLFCSFPFFSHVVQIPLRRETLLLFFLLSFFFSPGVLWCAVGRGRAWGDFGG